MLPEVTYKTHIVIRSSCNVGSKLIVIDPDPGGVLDGDAIIVVDVANVEIPHDNIIDALDSDSALVKECRIANSNQGLVGANLDP